MPSAGRESSGYETPVLRRGLVVRAVSDAPGGEKATIRRTAEEAQELGRRISDSLQDYMDAITRGIVASAEQMSVSCDVPREVAHQVARARYAPGLIIDFPQHETTIDGLHVRERTCITICQFEDASKIWTRLLLRGAERKPADEERTRRFFEVANTVSQRVIEEVRAVYERHFREQPSAARADAKFEDVGRLDFYGFDQRGLKLPASLSGDQADATYVDLLKRRFSPLADSITSSKETKVRLASLTPRDLRYCAGAASKPSLFSVLFEPHRAIFLVLSVAGAAADNLATSDVARPSGALTAMRSLATRVGRQF